MLSYSHLSAHSSVTTKVLVSFSHFPLFSFLPFSRFNITSQDERKRDEKKHIILVVKKKEMSVFTSNLKFSIPSYCSFNLNTLKKHTCVRKMKKFANSLGKNLSVDAVNLLNYEGGGEGVYGGEHMCEFTQWKKALRKFIRKLLMLNWNLSGFLTLKLSMRTKTQP